MIQLKNIHYEIGTRKLLSGADWNIDEGNRIALIGPNGTGKTTLLKIITGEIEASSGQIIRPSGYEIGYLPQEEISLNNETVLNLVLSGRKDLLMMESRLEQILNLLNDQVYSPMQQDLLTEQSQLEYQLRIRNGYHFRAEAKKILAGIGFGFSDFGKNLKEFSGGWRMRAYLAKLLLQKTDLLLLDEPTNHLDLPSLEWLENYLKKYKGSLIIVSHDRFLIDKIAGEIVELDKGSLLHYPGNFHDYEIQKQLRTEQAVHDWKNLKKIKDQQKKFIDRFRYKATKASQVQSRVKKLEKLDNLDLPETEKIFSFTLKVDIPSFKNVAHFDNVFFRYHETWVLENISFHISRNDKIALVGKNGAGKTTLTKLISGDLIPQKGKITTGERLEIGYFAQHRIEELNINNSIYQEILQTVSDSHRTSIRNILGLFMFSGDDVDKKIQVLSGGEKARVSLAKILLSPVNFLIMDEPTNHLDTLSRQALEKALQDYNGTLLLISHDRYFLDKLIHRVFELEIGRLSEFEGNYSDYLLLKAQKQNVELKENVIKKPESTAQKNKVKKRVEARARQALSSKRNQLLHKIREIEHTIEKLEKKKSEMEYNLGRPDNYKDSTLIINLQVKYRETSNKLDLLLKEWEIYQQEYESLMQSLRDGL